jgi:hypothetical protein
MDELEDFFQQLTPAEQSQLPPIERRIFELRRLGYSNQAIMNLLDLKHDRKIRRAVEHVRAFIGKRGMRGDGETA